MFIHIRTPVTVSGFGRVVPGQIIALTGAEALPLIAAGQAVPDPELDELKERARKLGQNADWHLELTAPRQPRAGVVTATATQESFATKLSKATTARAATHATTVKEWNERAQKERRRYGKVTRRPHTKSD